MSAINRLHTFTRWPKLAADRATLALTDMAFAEALCMCGFSCKDPEIRRIYWVAKHQWNDCQRRKED